MWNWGYLGYQFSSINENGEKVITHKQLNISTIDIATVKQSELKAILFNLFWHFVKQLLYLHHQRE